MAFWTFVDPVVPFHCAPCSIWLFMTLLITLSWRFPFILAPGRMGCSRLDGEQETRLNCLKTDIVRV